MAEAAIDADPAAIAATVKVALDAPDATPTLAGTVATDGLLLESATFIALAAGPLNVTVPCTVVPAMAVALFNDTMTLELGAVGEFD